MENKKNLKDIIKPVIGWLLFFVVLVGGLYVALNTRICSECGKTFIGKGYYSYDSMMHDNIDETLCESCARREWSPFFDYKDYIKD